jgi:hypothetical protein
MKLAIRMRLIILGFKDPSDIQLLNFQNVRALTQHFKDDART